MLRRYPDMTRAGEPKPAVSQFLNQLKTLPVRLERLRTAGTSIASRPERRAGVGRSGEQEPERRPSAARPDLLRGLTQPRYSRRRFIRGAAGLVAAGSLAGMLSACGIAGTRDTGWKDGFDWGALVEASRASRGRSTSPTGRSTSTAPRTARRPSSTFSDKYGITVNYRPVIQDNASFFAQISPVLQAGQSTGYDMVVISNGWQLTQMIKNHWLIPLDHSRMPNFKRYAARRA